MMVRMGKSKNRRKPASKSNVLFFFLFSFLEIEFTSRINRSPFLSMLLLPIIYRDSGGAILKSICLLPDKLINRIMSDELKLTAQKTISFKLYTLINSSICSIFSFSFSMSKWMYSESKVLV